MLHHPPHHHHLWHAVQHPVWFRQALCIHSKEGAWNDHGAYGGGMQILVSTWDTQAAGGEVPHVSSTWEIGHLTPRIQLLAAYRIWDRSRGAPHDGAGSWSQWGTAGACHLY